MFGWLLPELLPLQAARAKQRRLPKAQAGRLPHVAPRTAKEGAPASLPRQHPRPLERPAWPRPGGTRLPRPRSPEGGTHRSRRAAPGRANRRPIQTATSARCRKRGPPRPAPLPLPAAPLEPPLGGLPKETKSCGFCKKSFVRKFLSEALYLVFVLMFRRWNAGGGALCHTGARSGALGFGECCWSAAVPRSVRWEC